MAQTLGHASAYIKQQEQIFLSYDESFHQLLVKPQSFFFFISFLLHGTGKNSELRQFLRALEGISSLLPGSVESLL